jgi:hypothetical protein
MGSFISKWKIGGFEEIFTGYLTWAIPALIAESCQSF